MPIAVSIVEDSAPYRAKLISLLGEARNFRFVSAHATAEDALADLPLNDVDVALVDLLLPKMSGVELIRELKARSANLRILALTVVHDSDIVYRALQAGAEGYLVKRAPTEQILEAITHVTTGGIAFGRGVARKVLQFFQRLPTPDPGLERLSDCEIEILEQMSIGRGDKEIAELLGMKYDTVRFHVKRILKKLQVESRTAAAVKYAVSSTGR